MGFGVELPPLFGELGAGEVGEFSAGRCTEYGLEVAADGAVLSLKVLGAPYPLSVGPGASVGPGVTVVPGAGTQPGGQELLGA